MKRVHFDAVNRGFDQNADMPVIRMIVEGHVQGVGFRAHARRVAHLLGVTGRVWNRADGAVEVLAAHFDRAILKQFEARLREGPGQVDRIGILPGDGEFHEFEIGPSV